MEDVIIVGAGAAGVACAHALSQKSVRFRLLEAQDRVGGRVLSQKDTQSLSPIELGAEFIHGAPKEMLQLLAQFQVPFYDVRDQHLIFNNGKLNERENYWIVFDQIFKKIKTKSRDCTIESFLNSIRSVQQKDRDLFTAYVQGFHAADLNLMGIRALEETSQQKDDSLNGSGLFRPLIAYDLLLTRILESVVPKDRMSFNSLVKKITWQKNKVELAVETGPDRHLQTLSCRKLILTLPIGVLKNSQLEWAPFPDLLNKSLEAIHMGHVQKITFRFRERFWEKLSDKPAAFFHMDPKYDFPTWWTMQPLRTPDLVAWQGGPRAAAMSELKDQERIVLALQTLSRLTRRSLSQLNSEVESIHTHNWSKDPFSQGAYSYVGVNGLGKVKNLSKSIQETIYFAGEGFAPGSGRGTVHGAFKSGIRAAQEVC